MGNLEKAKGNKRTKQAIPLPFVVHYWRYGGHYTEGFETLKEAKEMLDYGEDYGELSTELIETPDGVIEGDELHPIIGGRIPGCHDYKLPQRNVADRKPRAASKNAKEEL